MLTCLKCFFLALFGREEIPPLEYSEETKLQINRARLYLLINKAYPLNSIYAIRSDYVSEWVAKLNNRDIELLTNYYQTLLTTKPAA